MQLFVSAEDEVSRTVISKMANVVFEGEIDLVPLGQKFGGFGYIRKHLPKFCDLAEREKVVLLTDLDQAECAPSLRASWLSTMSGLTTFPEQLVFCVAVREVEAWLLADRGAFAEYFKVPTTMIAENVEETTMDPKRHLVTVVRRSADRRIRDAIVPNRRSSAAVGLGYNQVLSEFVRECWMPERGACSNRSLERAVVRLDALLSAS